MNDPSLVIIIFMMPKKKIVYKQFEGGKKVKLCFYLNNDHNLETVLLKICVFGQTVMNVWIKKSVREMGEMMKLKGQ